MIAAGYMAYRDSPDYLSYQKTIRNSGFVPGDQIRYSINIRLWQFPSLNDKRGMDAWVQLYLSEAQTFRIELSIRQATTLEFVEKFFAESFLLLDCVPDLDNNY